MAQTHEGALKARARRLGLAVDELRAEEAAGRRWCSSCESFLDRDDFSETKTICRLCRRAYERSRYQLIPPDLKKPLGPPPGQPRPGDKRQARARVNCLVRSRKLPHPNELPCVDCGHRSHPGCHLRHEYDHADGYTPDAHLSLEVVCQPCHLIRTGERMRCHGRTA